MWQAFLCDLFHGAILWGYGFTGGCMISLCCRSPSGYGSYSDDIGSVSWLMCRPQEMIAMKITWYISWGSALCSVPWMLSLVREFSESSWIGMMGLNIGHVPVCGCRVRNMWNLAYFGDFSGRNRMLILTTYAYIHNCQTIPVWKFIIEVVPPNAPPPPPLSSRWRLELVAWPYASPQFWEGCFNIRWKSPDIMTICPACWCICLRTKGDSPASMTYDVSPAKVESSHDTWTSRRRPTDQAHPVWALTSWSLTVGFCGFSPFVQGDTLSYQMSAAWCWGCCAQEKPTLSAGRRSTWLQRSSRAKGTARAWMSGPSGWWFLSWCVVGHPSRVRGTTWRLWT